MEHAKNNTKGGLDDEHTASDPPARNSTPAANKKANHRPTHTHTHMEKHSAQEQMAKSRNSDA